MYIHCTRWYRIQVAHLIVRSHIQTFIYILCQIFLSVAWLSIFVFGMNYIKFDRILEKSSNYLTWTSSSCVEIVSILPNNVLSSELNSRSSSRTSENMLINFEHEQFMIIKRKSLLSFLWSNLKYDFSKFTIHI